MFTKFIIRLIQKALQGKIIIMLDLTALTTEVGNNSIAAGNLVTAIEAAIKENNQPAVDALAATLRDTNAKMTAAIPAA